MNHCVCRVSVFRRVRCVCFIGICLFLHTSCQISRHVFPVSFSSLRVANGAATRPGFPGVCVALLLVVHIGRFPAYFIVAWRPMAIITSSSHRFLSKYRVSSNSAFVVQDGAVFSPMMDKSVKGHKKTH